jgi:hypothetical protein
MMGGGPKAQQSNNSTAYPQDAKASHQYQQQSKSPPQQSIPQPHQTEQQTSHSKASAEQIHVNGSNNHKSKQGSNTVPVFSSKLLVPRPFQLKCISLGPSMVDLEWKLVPPVAVSRPIPISTYAFELSWRDRSVNVHAQVWESTKKLISGNQCRKKNLTAGATYDFRVRAVEELAGGMLGGRSEWSEVLNVVLKAVQTAPSTSSAPPSCPSGHGFSYKSSSVGSSTGKATYTSTKSAQNKEATADGRGSSKQHSRHVHKDAYVGKSDSEESVEEDDEESDEVAEDVDEEEILYSNASASKSVDVETETPRSPAKHAWKQRSPDANVPSSNPNSYQHTASSRSNTSEQGHKNRQKSTSASDTSTEEMHHQSHDEASTEGEEEWRPNKAREKAKAKRPDLGQRTAYLGREMGKSSGKVHGEDKEHEKKMAKEAQANGFGHADGNTNGHKHNSQRNSKGNRQSWNQKVDVWQQIFDEAGNAYYYNADSQESKWEAPEWIEETDAESGAR